MGGKKKTKWRKLSLDEFTKEVPSKPETEDTSEADITRKENYIPPYDETVEISQNCVQPYQYIDDIWYPSSCAVYNPAEVGLYSNYVMPFDTSYYYYAIPQMQEYVPVPYQEYTAQFPKGSVYVLLPTPTFQASQPVQSVATDWQSRRRRKRYEEFADYAVIPETTYSNQTEVIDRSRRTEQHVNSRRNSAQTNAFRRMTSFSEEKRIDESNPVSEFRPKSNEKKNSIPRSDLHSQKDFISVNREMYNSENSQKSKKNLEMCGIHKKATIDGNDSQTIMENLNSSLSDISSQEVDFHTSVENQETEKSRPYELGNISNAPQSYNPNYDLPNKSQTSEQEKTQKESDKESYKTDDIQSSSKKISTHISSTQNDNQKVNRSIKTATHNEEDISGETELFNSSLENIPEAKSSSATYSKYPAPLPDILRTLKKSTANEKTRDPPQSSNRLDWTDPDTGKNSLSKSLRTQTSCLPSVLHSDSLHNESEQELKQLNSLNSLQAYQSLYKLAYDETVTDQSESDSRSPSPVEPESQVPASLTSAEILIHEADSDSDAGSEDVELLPHRYESETFLNENKHVYVNKLSLAVELLRTQESLPYDDEFKRLVGENNNVPGVHTSGKVNQGFVQDSSSPSETNHSAWNKVTSSKNENEIASSCQQKHSAIFNDLGCDNLDEQLCEAALCEAAKEAIVHNNEIQDQTEEIRAGYRRFGVQAQHFFSPRAAFSLNPCFCCIIM